MGAGGVKLPTVKQAEKLRILADGYIAAVPRRSDWVGLMRHGWVERVDATSPRGGLLPPLRITDEGRRALEAIEPEEGECISTTSAKTSRRAEASTSASPSRRSRSSVSISRRPAPVPLRRSFVSSGPQPIDAHRIALVRSLIPPASDVHEEIDTMERDLEIRRLQRRRDWTANVTRSCPSCKLFVRNAAVRCPHCGYDRDIGWAA